MKELLGDRIKHYRERVGLSQRALAAGAKVDPQTIYRLEKGRNWLDYETLSRLASTLNVDERALFADPKAVPEPTDAELLKLLEKRLNHGAAASALSADSAELLRLFNDMGHDQAKVLLQAARTLALKDTADGALDLDDQAKKRK